MTESQRQTVFGAWIFLASEALVFAGLFLGYIVYSLWYGSAFAEATAEHQDIFLGTANTLILLTSSLTMAQAVDSKQNRVAVRNWLLVTALLGVVFLAIKAWEWHVHYAEQLMPGAAFNVSRQQPGIEMYFLLYFLLTGLHFLHLLIGVLLVSLLIWINYKELKLDWNPVEIGGLYWHFVDIVWVFLFAMFYLRGRS